MNLYVTFRYIPGKTTQAELALVGAASELAEAKALLEGKEKGYHLTWYNEGLHDGRRRWSATVQGTRRCVIVELSSTDPGPDPITSPENCPHASVNETNGLCYVCQKRVLPDKPKYMMTIKPARFKCHGCGRTIVRDDVEAHQQRHGLVTQIIP